MFTTVLCDTAMLSLVPFMVKFFFPEGAVEWVIQI
jgi:hypothetical protein